MIAKTVTLINRLGLHARAATLFVNTCGRYQCKITLTHQGRDLDAKDVLAMLSLGAAVGTEFTLTFEGEDESEAADTIVSLIENRFGEEE